MIAGLEAEPAGFTVCPGEVEPDVGIVWSPSGGLFEQPYGIVDGPYIEGDAAFGQEALEAPVGGGSPGGGDEQDRNCNGHRQLHGSDAPRLSANG
jgi:hypothetical protein